MIKIKNGPWKIENEYCYNKLCVAMNNVEYYFAWGLQITSWTTWKTPDGREKHKIICHFPTLALLFDSSIKTLKKNKTILFFSMYANVIFFGRLFPSLNAWERIKQVIESLQ